MAVSAIFWTRRSWQFDPSQAAAQEATTDAVIAYAKQDWPTLEVAVDKKIDDQTSLV